MQKGPAQVSSGNIAPTVIGPQKDLKDVFVLSGLVLVLSGLIAAAWYYGHASEQVKIAPATENVDNANLSEFLKNAGAVKQAETSAPHPASATAPAATPADIIHADVYFEVGRKGLTDEAKALLSSQAGMLKQHEEYGVLIQGYTDYLGSASYNRKLGLQRAETVKAELMNAGIDEYRIAVVSLGEEGVLCVDSSDICRRINRRAHLEIRRIGREHMAAPAVAGPASTSPSEAASGGSITTGDPGLTTEGTFPALPDPSGATLESASGS